VPSASTRRAVARENLAAGRAAVAEIVSVMEASDLAENRNARPRRQRAN
jgi:hypothetical protein